MAHKGRFVVLIVLVSLLALIAATGVIGRSIFLGRIRAEVRASLEFSRMSLSVLPPALVLEDVRSKAGDVPFSAKRISLTTGLLSLLSRTRPVTVFIDQPALKLTPAFIQKLGSRHGVQPLPFSIERALVRDADLTLETPDVVLHSSKANCSFQSHGRTFTLEASIGSNLLAFPPATHVYQGQVRVLIEGDGERLNVRRLTVEGPSLALKARGVMTRLADPDFDFSLVFDGPPAMAMDYFEVPFTWGGKVRGEGTVRRSNGRLRVETSLQSQDLTMTGLPVGDVNGRFLLENEQGLVDLGLTRRAEPEARLRITVANRIVKGHVSGVNLDPVMKEIELAWPVSSTAWGDFKVENDHLHVDAELRAAELTAAPDATRFPFQGSARVDWDGLKHVALEAKKLDSSFGRADFSGTIDIDRAFDLAISGEVSDVAQARRFLELFLETKFDLPELSGRGSGDVRVTGDFEWPTINARFFLYPGGFDKFRAAFVEGTLGVQADKVDSTIRVDDPQLTGVVDVKAAHRIVDVNIKATRAKMEYVFPDLDLSLPAAGEASGQFKVHIQGDDFRVSGDFAAPAASLFGLPVKAVEGRLELGPDSLAFPELRFTLNGGTFEGRGRIGFANKDYDLDLKAESVDLAPLLPGLRGLAAFNLKGQGAFGKDTLTGRAEVRNPGYDYLQADALEGDLTLAILEDRLAFGLKGRIGPGANDVDVGLSLPLGHGPYVLNLKGSVDNLDILLPLPGAKGRLNYLAEVRGTDAGPQVTGAVDAQGQVLPIPGFPQALNDFSALAFIENRTVSLRSFQATLGGGRVQGSGEFRLAGPGPAINLGIEGRDMILVPWERTRALADANLQLTSGPGGPTLEGDILFKRLSWRREVNEPFAISTKAFYQPQRGPSLFDNLRLNVRLRANDDALVENSLGRIRTRFNLGLTGTVNAPVVLGDIEVLSGTVNFQGRTFNILTGKLSFFNPVAVEPYVDLRAEAYVKDYRVTVTVNGLVDRLRPEFASSPPLPPEDVLALLTAGESFKRTYISDLSSQISSATLVANQLSEQAQKQASKIFSLDRISIDPFVMGSTTELVPRLTLGKRISRSVFIYYSTNLTTQREEIVRMEWELGRNFSLVGNRDELGIISLDVKLRKRF